MDAAANSGIPANSASRCDRLFARAYRDFGVEPPAAVDRWGYWTTVVGAMIYVACMWVFWVTLNIGSLPLGVFVEPLWRPEAKFRRLKLPGGIPLIAIALPILLAYTSYVTYLRRGLWFVVGPYLLVAVAGTFFIAAFVCFNLVRRALAGRSR